MKRRAQFQSKGQVILAFMVLGIMACNPQENTVDAASAGVHIFLNQTVADKNVWHDKMERSLKDNDDISSDQYYYNMLDSSQVYALLRATNLSVAEEWSNAINGSGPSIKASSLYLKNQETLNLNVGTGETYIYVNHTVKDYDQWYDAFFSMTNIKEADSIYTLGVFSAAKDPLNVTVLARAESMEKASDYGGFLEDSHLMDHSGVLTTNAMVLRVWDYGKKK